ncbi:hypothetical protein ISF_05923 [Cordyceps fumosorosea ARSEF 2679]|uniref:Tat pathway signal sequence n=1 Tax=Cordyceps fumosorosea (strain ARSEF 2679) TaxID=1081104 RepID=A0A167TRZ3_CORFA|nr:hypothetical protein ISF_05923 [Cordyceps fumosorosea ARSEF 2679]OAA60884.1 hypothetical protein ISF_05923 [Cordyceps fumosorosea ARSEF 2679]
MEQKTTDRPSDEEPFLNDQERDQFQLPLPPAWQRRWAKFLPFSVVLNIGLILALLAVLGLLRHDPSKHYIPNEIYSPAHSVVEYENIHFTGGLESERAVSKYRGSSKEVDDAWENLYNTAPLINASTRFSNDSNQYMVQLDVFHQLHCLNMLRQVLYPLTYHLDVTSGTQTAKSTIHHMEHCYEQLRQAIQCSSDLSTITWAWSRDKGRYVGNVHTMHTCRNFDKIHEWAEENMAKQELDFFGYVEGSPIFPPELDDFDS